MLAYLDNVFPAYIENIDQFNTVEVKLYSIILDNGLEAVVEDNGGIVEGSTVFVSTFCSDTSYNDRYMKTNLRNLFKPIKLISCLEYIIKEVGDSAVVYKPSQTKVIDLINQDTKIDSTKSFTCVSSVDPRYSSED